MSLAHELNCPFCEKSITINVMDKGTSACIGGILLKESYYAENDKPVSKKILDFACKHCGTQICAVAGFKSNGQSFLKTEIREQGGSLTIRHLGGGNPGIVNFSLLYPVPPQADNQGNIPLPAGGSIQVFQAVVGDIYIYKHIDPPIQVCNETQTGYFTVSRKLSNEPGFSQHAEIWGKAICAQHPHLQNCVTYNLSDPGDRIHLTYNMFSKYLLDKGKMGIKDLVEMPVEQQYKLLLDTLKEEKK
jgi:hypothetical protein